MPTSYELSVILGSTFHDRERIDQLAKDWNFSRALLDLDGPPVRWWQNFLALARNLNRLDELLGRLREECEGLREKIDTPSDWGTSSVLGKLPEGGPYDAEWDVGRKENERIVLDRLNGPKTSVVVVAPDGWGRSWFLKRISHRLEAIGPASRVLLFDNLVVREEEDKFFCDLTAKTVQKTGQIFCLSNWNPNHLAPAQFTNSIEQAAQNSQEKLFLVIDVPSVFWHAPWKESFLGVLRTVANDTTDPLGKVVIVLAYSTYPSLGKTGSGTSPLNVPPVELDDFCVADIYELSRKYNVSLSTNDLELLHKTVGAHPRLVRRVLDHCCENPQQPLSNVLDASCVDVGGMFFDHFHGLKSLLEENQLLEELKMIHKTGKRPGNSKSLMMLHAAGVIRREPTGNYGLRYGILEHLFR